MELPPQIREYRRLSTEAGGVRAKSEGERLGLTVSPGHLRVSGTRRTGAGFSSDPSLTNF